MPPFGIRAIVYACALLLVVLVVGGVGYRLGSAHSRVQLAECKTKAEKTISAMAKAESELQAKYRKVEQAKALEIAGIAVKHVEDLTRVQAESNRVVAELRAGNLKLRKHWQASEATDRVSDAATAARHADEITRLRQEAIGRIRGIGAEADAQVRGLQEVVREYTK